MVKRSNRLFRYLWGGQLISNLGTQTSLYGVGLWLFSQSGQLLDFGLVAMVVQGARLLALPLFLRVFSTWRPGRLMVLCHATGAVCTALLAFLLLSSSADAPPPLVGVLAIQALAAVAEALLVVRLSSLIPLLISDQERLQRANGLFATVDGLVITMAPFLGSWLVASQGLGGVLLVDGISFVLALLSVLVAPWLKEVRRLNSVTSVVPDQIFAAGTLHRLMSLWQRSLQARSALVLTALTAFVYASLEVLFPAWVSLAYSPEWMGWVLITGAFGYLIGFACWRWLLGHRWRTVLPLALVVQALILMGAGLQAFAHRPVIWFGAVFVFSAALPVVMAALHQAWVTLAPRDSLPRYFSLRYGCEWATRLCAFLAVPLLADYGLRPLLDWPLWPSWLLGSLGTGQGRVMAIGIGSLGWVIVAGLCARRLSLVTNPSIDAAGPY
ncbi:Major Facilitator Superfamily protein [Synechococcus sp. MIT S9508]|nr:Major Facilitator Superfamily protein [Synechococcus sp. MIT S9508]